MHDDAMTHGWPRRADATYAIISQWTGRGRGGDAKERRPRRLVIRFIGSLICVNNANLSGNVQRVGTTNDTTSGIGIGIGIGYWYR